MVFGSIVSSPRANLSAHQALELANVYLENANNADDADISLVLCHDTEVSLSQARKAIKHTKNQSLVDGITAAYFRLGKLLEERGHGTGAQASFKKAEKLGRNVQDPVQSVKSSRSSGVMTSIKDTLHSSGSSHSIGSVQHSIVAPQKQPRDIANIPSYIFSKNVPPPTAGFKLPEPDERLSSALQLVCCLSLLQDFHSPDDISDPAARQWLQAVMRDVDEQERLHTMATEIIRAFKRDEIKDAKIIAEVVCLAPVLNKDTFNDLLREFYSGIDGSGLLNYHQVEGLAQLIQGADPGHLSADDLVKILELLSTRLRDTHQQSTQYIHQLTMAVSHVLDAMTDTKVIGLDREKLHEPLSTYLKDLQESKDTYLVYQAAYAYQALLCIPDNETVWQAAMRRTGKVVQGVSGLVSAVKGLDLIKFMEGLEDIQKGCAGVSVIFDVVTSAYKDVSSLVENGRSFMDSLKQGLSFERKRDWYSALRGADALIRDGELATFKKLVCEAPCRLDPAFQWGVCQRLGEIATNPLWDAGARRSAIEFLGEIYQNDEVWGQQLTIKQWILNVLMQISASTESSQLNATIAETLLQKLEASGDDKKQDLYRMWREKGPISYPLKDLFSELTSSSLLDRVQNRTDVESSLRVLRKQRTKERSSAVYIPPQAKTSLQASDDDQFSLMGKVKEFLDSDQKVFLLLGESGAGKSTFSRELEYELWQSYKNRTGRIPLHISLAAIDKPEHDMIAKRLRRVEFTEPQIREMKQYR
ncbi:hypothetical protein BGX34_003343, partial [Mortierella sp. NVP85]